ncbi:MAG: hypothetical protein J6O04_12050 [Selenomonadaceae bacterium]|nr:hypothetical protein [Selenomonadaceae bacterium]
MLKKMEEKRIIPLDVARTEYPKTKKIFVITDMSNIADIKGYVCAVSMDKSSFGELLDMDKKIQKDGHQTMLIGSYENGGAIGVQYEFSR